MSTGLRAATMAVVIAIGIDPGTAACGFGVVRLETGKLALIDAGVVRTPATAPEPERLRQLHEALGRLLAEHRPDRIAVERLFFQRNVQTAMVVGQARGIALLAASEWNVPIDEPTPNEVKQQVCGNGSADKQQVSAMVAAPAGHQAGRRAGRRDRCARHRDRLRLPRGGGAAGGGRLIGSVRGTVTHVGQDHALIEVARDRLSDRCRPGAAGEAAAGDARHRSSPIISSGRTSRRCSASHRPRSSASSSC